MRAPGLWVESQTNQGQWRLEDRYPPEGMATLGLDLGGALMNVAGTTTILPNGATGPVYETEPLEEDIWIAGLPRLHYRCNYGNGCWRADLRITRRL